MKALIFNGKIIQTEAQEFPVHKNLTWVDFSDTTPAPKVGWSYNGEVFTAPPSLLSPPPKSEAPLNAEELATHLIKKGTITQGEIDTIKTAR